MKNILFLGLLCCLFLGVFSQSFAASDQEIRDAYRSHFRGEKLTQEQKVMLSALSNDQKSKFYRESLRESIAKREQKTPDDLENDLHKPGMKVEF